MKKAKPSTVSKSSNPFGLIQIPSTKIRNINPSVVVKKPHSMTSLYLDPIKSIDVEPNVIASAKGYVVPKVVGNDESFERSNSGIVSLDNPRFDKTLGQSSMNVNDKDTVDKSICVLISQIWGTEPKSVVVSDVITSLAQTDHPIKTSLEKSDGNSDSEFVPIKSPEKSEEKGDSDIMFVDMSNKEENSGVKKDQSTDIVNVDDPDSNDEPTACTEKKSRLEILINALSEEDVEGNLDGDKEEYNEVEEDANASGDDVEETTNNNDD
ncbi:hypothetical protein KIW84_031826 [Lathyrus oleraceus]|uniref:Uncharacterized protein n=1 Tax=Pisum sativum TaxID=3888 RepID=A0A9D4XVX0_PEA|nr:hypothetical protein KIW84_031826 [Pisum sativum]